MTELEVFQKSLEVSRITLIVSIVLSTSSIVFAALEMAFQRSHNKKSVRPLCDVRIDEGDGLRIGLWNPGLGPMIVKQVLLRAADGSTVAEFPPPLPVGVRAARVRSGMVLPPGGSLVLMECVDGTGKGIPSMKEALGGRTVVVEYEDIYERAFTKEASLDFGS
jgi:hypothetical protein